MEIIAIKDMTTEQLKYRLAYVEHRLKYWRNQKALGYDDLICNPRIKSLLNQKKEIKERLKNK